ncbi:unnamed protein product [Amoebophrya sp. A25]|nr:unnamed protein product [Amoebophrya sp. A25]|eukprot:GSA25T00012872001.1
MKKNQSASSKALNVVGRRGSSGGEAVEEKSSKSLGRQGQGRPSVQKISPTSTARLSTSAVQGHQEPPNAARKTAIAPAASSSTVIMEEDDEEESVVVEERVTAPATSSKRSPEVEEHHDAKSPPEVVEELPVDANNRNNSQQQHAHLAAPSSPSCSLEDVAEEDDEYADDDFCEIEIEEGDPLCSKKGPPDEASLPTHSKESTTTGGGVASEAEWLTAGRSTSEIEKMEEQKLDHEEQAQQELLEVVQGQGAESQHSPQHDEVVLSPAREDQQDDCSLCFSSTAASIVHQVLQDGVDSTQKLDQSGASFRFSFTQENFLPKVEQNDEDDDHQVEVETGRRQFVQAAPSSTFDGQEPALDEEKETTQSVMQVDAGAEGRLLLEEEGVEVSSRGHVVADQRDDEENANEVELERTGIIEIPSDDDDDDERRERILPPPEEGVKEEQTEDTTADNATRSPPIEGGATETGTALDEHEPFHHSESFSPEKKTEPLIQHLESSSPEKSPSLVPVLRSPDTDVSLCHVETIESAINYKGSTSTGRSPPGSPEEGRGREEGRGLRDKRDFSLSGSPRGPEDEIIAPRPEDEIAPRPEDEIVRSKKTVNFDFYSTTTSTVNLVSLSELSSASDINQEQDKPATSANATNESASIKGSSSRQSVAAPVPVSKQKAGVTEHKFAYLDEVLGSRGDGISIDRQWQMKAEGMRREKALRKGMQKSAMKRAQGRR